MLKFLKKLVSFGLGICMLVTGIPKASAKSAESAEIEVWTFSDNTRITRFHRKDFEAMIKLYDYYVQENEKRLFNKGQNIAAKVAGICQGIVELVGSGILIYNYANYDDINDAKYVKKSAVVGAGLLGLSGMTSIIASFYPEYKKSKVEKDITRKARNEKTSWIGVKDIRDMLIEERDTVKELLRGGVKDHTKAIKDLAPEVISLIPIYFEQKDLEGYSGCYVLIERPYRSDNYAGDVVFPRLCADYKLKEKDEFDWFIYDLIKRLKSEGIRERNHKKIDPLTITPKLSHFFVKPF